MASVRRSLSQRSDVTVQVSGVTRRFGKRKVLNGIDLTIASGEFVALLGRSGSGKSTLLRAVAGIDHEVRGDGTIEIPERSSVVFQDARLLPWMRVLDNVILELPGKDAARRGMAALAEVGLEEHAKAWPKTLSGGEQQRVALARSLVREPELLLADEPFGALDALTRIRMHHLLRDLCARHHPAVLLVTHDVDEAILLADRIIVLEDGHLGLDLEVPLGGKRRHSDPRFLETRTTLLGALGVDPD